jgi:hypothetical protein
MRLAQQEWEADVQACFSVLDPGLAAAGQVGPRLCKLGIGGLPVSGQLRLSKDLFSAAMPAT